MTDDPDPTTPNWLLISLLGWLVHLGLASGLAFRTLVTGPQHARTFAEYNLRLPWLSEVVLKTTGPMAGSLDLTGWLLAGLAAFDLAMLLALARWERPLWKWWFWGVALALLLLLLLVEFAYYLPAVKLREALSRQ